MVGTVGPYQLPGDGEALLNVPWFDGDQRMAGDVQGQGGARDRDAGLPVDGGGARPRLDPGEQLGVGGVVLGRPLRLDEGARPVADVRHGDAARGARKARWRPPRRRPRRGR